MWQVIGRNIKSSGDINPMLPGHRVTAIFGFCDIRQFTDATEVLQEEVMEFVNSIAKIVHLEVGGQAYHAQTAACSADSSTCAPTACVWRHDWHQPLLAMRPQHSACGGCIQLPCQLSARPRLQTCISQCPWLIGGQLQVSLHGGSANKNIGDAFLLVWKIPDQVRFPAAASLAPSRSNSLTSAINRKLFPRRCAGPGQLHMAACPPAGLCCAGLAPAAPPVALLVCAAVQVPGMRQPPCLPAIASRSAPLRCPQVSKPPGEQPPAMGPYATEGRLS